MKYFVTIFVLLNIVLSAHAELTSDDLLKIQEIVNKAVKDSETRMKEYVDIKIEALDKRITESRNLIYVLIALIGALIGMPLWRDRKDRKLEKQLEQQIETLTQEIEILKKQRTTTS